MNTIDRVVDTLIAIRPLVEKIGSPVLITLIDASLLEVGKLIAGKTGPEKHNLH